MSANMTIDQAGLPAGTAGRARTDGLDTGALVTLTSSGGGTTHRFRLLWVPVLDTTAVASLTQTGPTTWTFSPQASRYGTYRIELIVDEGLATEDRQIRIFGIRTPIKGLRLPALNELASATASLEDDGADQVAASEDNELLSGPFASGNYGGWYPELDLLFQAVEAGGGGGGGPTSLVGATNEYVSILGSEVVVGGFVFDGSATLSSIELRVLGTVWSAVADVDLLLYDLGAPGSPVSAVLRSTINLATVGVPVVGTQALSATGSPGVNANQVYNTERMYEVRVLVNAAVPGDAFQLLWSGLDLA